MLFLWGNQQIFQFQGGWHYGKDKITQMTLNKWFEEWFTDGKAHKAKETSISSMKKNFKRTFGFYIGTRKIEDIKPMDVQKAINAMENGYSPKFEKYATRNFRKQKEFSPKI